MTRIQILAGLCCLFSLPLWADTVNSDNVPKMGEQTRNWLDLQRSGDAASSQPQTISGPVAARIHQRYQDSFTHPIPAFFSGDEGDASVLDK
ncbi:MAG: DUF3613 domain-containing protein [Methylophaga sp.]